MDNLLKQKLKRLIESSDWDVIYAFQARMVEKWNKDEVKADSEFQTLWNLAKREGKIEGLKEFLDGGEKLALDND